MDLNEEPPESQENMLVFLIFRHQLLLRGRYKEELRLFIYIIIAALSSPPEHKQHNFRLFKLRAVQMPKYKRVCVGE